jgi:hypothetical protein
MAQSLRAIQGPRSDRVELPGRSQFAPLRTERISSQFEQRRFDRHAGHSGSSTQWRSLPSSMRRRARGARSAQRPDAPLSHQGGSGRSRDRRGFSLRSGSRHHHIPRSLGQSHVRRFQLTTLTTHRRCHAGRSAGIAGIAVSRCPALSQLPLEKAARRRQRGGFLFASRRAADGRHDRIRSRGMVPRLRVLQSASGAEETAGRGLWLLNWEIGRLGDWEVTKDAESFNPPIAQSTHLPMFYSENSLASSTHSPFGDSCWYARQWGFASTECPVFSNVIAR